MTTAAATAAAVISSGFANLKKFPKPFGEESDSTVSFDGGSLRLQPPPKSDFWRKTYYQPEMINDNGLFLYRTVPRDQVFTVATCFSLMADCQFDQAGLYLRVDELYWIKAGIEVVDKKPRLSCVVTNEYSDWSTQPWKRFESQDNSDNSLVLIPECKLRIHCRRESFVVEAFLNNQWDFIRIAHLKLSDSLLVGVFGACPTNQRGRCKAVFRDFTISMGSEFDHTAG